MASSKETKNQLVASSAQSQRGPNLGSHQTLILNQQNIKVENCHNVQFGANSVINQTYNSPASGSDDSDEDDQKFPAIGDDKLEKLKCCNRVVEDREFLHLAPELGINWRRLVRLLGVKDHDIEAALEDHSCSGNEEVVYQVLRMWKKEKGDDATVKALTDALEKCDLLHLSSCFE